MVIEVIKRGQRMGFDGDTLVYKIPLEELPVEEPTVSEPELPFDDE